MNAVSSQGHLYEHGSPTPCFLQMELVFLVLMLPLCVLSWVLCLMEAHSGCPRNASLCARLSLWARWCQGYDLDIHSLGPRATLKPP